MTKRPAAAESIVAKATFWAVLVVTGFNALVLALLGIVSWLPRVPLRAGSGG